MIPLGDLCFLGLAVRIRVMYRRPQSQMVAAMYGQMTQTIKSVCELVFLSPIRSSGDIVNGVMAVRRHVGPSMTSAAVKSAEPPAVFHCTHTDI